MREADLPIDRTKHAVYTKNARKCVQKLLRRYYDEQTAENGLLVSVRKDRS